MKYFIFSAVVSFSFFLLSGCTTTYTHANNHYCASNTWNGTRCVTSNNTRVVDPVVVKQPVVVR